MNEQEQYWAGDEGDAYQRRNRVEWKERIPFWNRMLGLTRATDVLEVGCGPGWNLRALRAADVVGPFVHGIDINPTAVEEAKAHHLDVKLAQASEIGAHFEKRFDLVLTAGLLIHIAPSDLDSVMKSIIAASRTHVLAIEYAADQEEQIEYRGQQGLLWKRPYGALYEALGLHVLDTGDAGAGFDRCTYWLMQTP